MISGRAMNQLLKPCVRVIMKVNVRRFRIRPKTFITTFASLMLASSLTLSGPIANASANACRDTHSNSPCPGNICPGYGGGAYWYAGISIADSSGNPKFNYAEGVKGNLTHGGLPFTYDSSSQHVNVYLSSYEDPNHCAAKVLDPNQIPGCWAQVGWITGYVGNVNGCTGSTSTGSAVEVYVEIYDDSGQGIQPPPAPSQYCTVVLFNSAPSVASYDERYYGAAPNGLNRYQIFYQVSGQGIQDLAYGDFNQSWQSQLAIGEVLTQDPDPGMYPNCPALGQNVNVNTLGALGPSDLFAQYLNLYKGYWTPWTTSAAPTYLLQNAPYYVQGVGSGSTDFENFENGGQ